MKRSLFAFTIASWLSLAPTIQASQQASLYVVAPKAVATGLRVYCDARWRDMTAAERAPEENYGRFLGRCLAQCPALRVEETQNYFEGEVRRDCDARWQHMLETDTTGALPYVTFVTQCARACPPSAEMARAAGVPELTAAAEPAVVGAAAAGAATATPTTSATASVIATAEAVGGAAIFAAVGYNFAQPLGPVDRPASP